MLSLSDLYRFMDDPSLLTQEMLPELRDLMDRYPYYQAVRLLYMKALALSKDSSLTEELERMAVFIPDRKRLFLLLEGDQYGLDIHAFEPSSSATKADSFSLIDDFLSSVDDEKHKEEESPLLFQPSVSADYLDWVLSDRVEQQPSKETQPAMQHQDLIDSFIQQSEEQVVHKPIEWREESEASTPESVKKLDEAHSKPLEDSYFTETLARIYVKQERYEKAMQIIKNLSLKYPEKNVYFADQIRFLEKLIINTKK